MPADEVSLRERKRRAVQDDLTLAAIDLFIVDGYDGTPVGRIAASVGMSERTFFRYFATKDDVLEHVSRHWRERVAARLDERPADEPAWTSLRRSFDEYVAETADEGRALPLLRVIYSTPSLHARHLLRMRSWRTGLADALARRSPDEPRVHLDALAGSAVECFETARETWVARNGRDDLKSLLDDSMSTVRRLRRP